MKKIFYGSNKELVRYISTKEINKVKVAGGIYRYIDDVEELEMVLKSVALFFFPSCPTTYIYTGKDFAKVASIECNTDNVYVVFPGSSVPQEFAKNKWMLVCCDVSDSVLAEFISGECDKYIKKLKFIDDPVPVIKELLATYKMDPWKTENEFFRYLLLNTIGNVEQEYSFDISEPDNIVYIVVDGILDKDFSWIDLTKDITVTDVIGINKLLYIKLSMLLQIEMLIETGKIVDLDAYCSIGKQTRTFTMFSNDIKETVFGYIGRTKWLYSKFMQYSKLWTIDEINDVLLAVSKTKINILEEYYLSYPAGIVYNIIFSCFGRY
jgi:hypothetical protein